MKRLTYLLFSSLLLAACVSTNVTSLSTGTYPPLQPEQVVIYLQEEDVPGPYEKIALIHARGDYATTDERAMFKQVRKRAARLGANGVLLQRVKEPGTGEKVAHHILGIGADRRGEMIAIWVEPTPNDDPQPGE